MVVGSDCSEKAAETTTAWSAVTPVPRAVHDSWDHPRSCFIPGCWSGLRSDRRPADFTGYPCLDLWWRHIPGHRSDEQDEAAVTRAHTAVHWACVYATLLRPKSTPDGGVVTWDLPWWWALLWGGSLLRHHILSISSPTTCAGCSSCLSHLLSATEKGQGCWIEALCLALLTCKHSWTQRGTPELRRKYSSCLFCWCFAVW